VTVVAAGNGAMARSQPPRILLVHHVTVGARRRIIREIRAPLGINKSKPPKPNRGPNGARRNDEQRKVPHACLTPLNQITPDQSAPSASPTETNGVLSELPSRGIALFCTSAEASASHVRAPPRNARDPLASQSLLHECRKDRAPEHGSLL